MPGVSAEFMRELSDFARETIQAKDQLIHFLMTQQRPAGPHAGSI
jgi:hypothetical protein